MNDQTKQEPTEAEKLAIAAAIEQSVKATFWTILYGTIKGMIVCSIWLVESMPDQRAKIIENCSDQLLRCIGDSIGVEGMTKGHMRQILAFVYTGLQDINDPTGVLREIHEKSVRTY